MHFDYAEFSFRLSKGEPRIPHHLFPIMTWERFLEQLTFKKVAHVGRYFVHFLPALKICKYLERFFFEYVDFNIICIFAGTFFNHFK